MGRVGKRQQHKPREQAVDLSTNNSQKTERVVRRDNNNEDIVDIEVYAHSKEHNDSHKATRMTADVCSRCLLDGDDTARAADERRYHRTVTVSSHSDNITYMKTATSSVPIAVIYHHTHHHT